MPFDIAIHIGHATSILDQIVIEPLVIPLDVVVLGVCLHGRPKVALAECRERLGGVLKYYYRRAVG